MRDSPASIGGLPLHTRSLTVSLKRSAEDRWLARGDVIDLRKNGFVPTSYDIQPAGVIHSMNLELELDPATLRIEAIRVDQPFVAVEPSEVTGGECCRDPAPRLLDLASECLDDDFAAKDTLLMLAPGFIQVRAAVMDSRLEEHAAARERGEDTGAAEVMNRGGRTGACYMWRENGPISMATFSPSDCD